MIYLILFGLDFYDKLNELLNVISVSILSFCVIGFVIFSVLYSEAVNMKDKEDIVYRVFSFSLYLYKQRWLFIFICSFTFLLPSSKTVAIATGLYTGEQIITYIQDSPLAKKAYQLAEKKIDELLEESQPKEEGKK